MPKRADQAVTAAAHRPPELTREYAEVEAVNPSRYASGSWRGPSVPETLRFDSKGRAWVKRSEAGVPVTVSAQTPKPEEVPVVEWIERMSAQSGPGAAIRATGNFRVETIA